MARNFPPKALQNEDSLKHDPQRARARENEPAPIGPLGDPPARLSGLQVEAWREVVSVVPDGVLFNADRLLVEKTARLMAREWQGEDLTAAEHNLMLRCFSLMGMTPADRARLNVPRKPERPKNKFAALESDDAIPANVQ